MPATICTYRKEVALDVKCMPRLHLVVFLVSETVIKTAKYEPILSYQTNSLERSEPSSLIRQVIHKRSEFLITKSQRKRTSNLVPHRIRLELGRWTLRLFRKIYNARASAGLCTCLPEGSCACVNCCFLPMLSK